MVELELKSGWLERSIESATVSVAASPLTYLHTVGRLSKRQIAMLRRQMRDQFKAVTGEEL